MPLTTRVLLYARAAGRCQFDGCNDYLLEHHVTHRSGNFAEMAHIRAFSSKGPRGGGDADGEPEKHDIENLMLLCPKCHKHVDDDPERFPIDALRKFKLAQEQRIFELTDTRPDALTVPVVLRGRIAGAPVEIPLIDRQAAVAPRHISARDQHEIDISGFDDDGSPEFWTLASKTIRQKMDAFYEREFGGEVPRHVSVFALAPIPLLMTLGACLSSKVPTTLYQRHRDTEDWRWKVDDEPVDFETLRVQEGSDPTAVALIVSISGRVAVTDLPPTIDRRYGVYEIRPAGGLSPGLNLVRCDSTLQAFRSRYQQTLRDIAAAHPSLSRIAVFPAAPAPCAVAMGRNRLPKRDPILEVFDFDKRNGGFVRTLEINAHDH